MIKNGKAKFFSTVFSAVVIALCSAAIIGLSIYADCREDYLYSGKERIYILLNSWSSLERETINLLVDSANHGDDKKWLYSLRTFDKRLDNFLNSSMTQKLARSNRLFERKINDMDLLWSTLKEKIENSASKLAEHIELNKNQNTAADSASLLYQAGYLSAMPDQSSQLAELLKIVNDCRFVMHSSRVHCTALLDEMNDIISDQAGKETANLRLMVFILSMAIMISMIFFIIQTQRGNRLYQLELERLVDDRTNELRSEKTRAESAVIQTEQINHQLAATVDRANLMSQKAAEASNAKNEFLASVSHEIRTPMNAVIGFSEMLAEENLAPAQKKQVRIIRDSSRYLLRLMNDILDFSKIETGKMSVDIIDYSVENVLTGVESLMRPSAAEQGIEFEIIRNDPLPDIIRTDPARLKQCLANLIANAIKFTEKGFVRLKISSELTDGKDFIRFDVEDSGIGVSSDKAESIFEPFARIDANTNRTFGGIGLGLTITRHLTELLGGTLTVKSVKGKGSVFTLTVPTGIEKTKSALIPAAGEKKENGKTLPTDINNLKLSGKVLIAEDSPTNQTLIELLLKRMGIESVVVENGQLAVERAQTGEFNIILMDIQMPVMNGYEAARQLRKDGINIPIIALTACAMKGDDKKCFAAGCNDYLTKPIDRKKLAETLAKYLPPCDEKSSVKPVSAAAQDTPKKPLPRKESASVDRSGIELDYQMLLERVGDEGLIDEIIPVFLRDNTSRLELLAQAVAKNDQKEIKFYAHSLKGASATIGAAKIAELAKQLETAARDEIEIIDSKAVFDEIKTRFARLTEFLSKSDWKQIAQQTPRPK
jgi:signal transduction histidine kinase/CheY-like chemotaxis protein/HPt (histidine-containing phosphotransfer) domain-containing protein